MLEQAGYVAASPADAAAEDADVIVINTCAVRENAADKPVRQPRHGWRGCQARPAGMQIAVGGCLAQKDRGTIVERAPWVDVVFGTHNLDVLPVLPLERARHNAEAQVEIEESLKVFLSTLPARRESAYSAWVSISVGCNNTCTFCIVPALRGKERGRRPGEILAEVEALVGQGAVEVTLLGPERELAMASASATGGAFAQVRCGPPARSRGWSGCGSRPRTRRRSPTTSSRRWRSTPTRRCAAPAHAAAVGPRPHPARDAPLVPRRTSSSASSTGSVRPCPTPRSPPTSSSASPARPRRTSEETLRVVEASRFASRVHVFQYSPRPRHARRSTFLDEPAEGGRPGALRPGLAALQRPISLEENQRQVGRTVEVLVAEAEGRKDGASHWPHRPRRRQPPRWCTSRSATGGEVPRPGDLVTVDVTYAAPYHLVADWPWQPGGRFEIRRTQREADAWDRRSDGDHGHPTARATRLRDRDWGRPDRSERWGCRRSVRSDPVDRAGTRSITSPRRCPVTALRADPAACAAPSCRGRPAV